MNGRAGKLTQDDTRPPRRECPVQAWDTALYNTDSTTEDKPPAYEEVDDDVGVENVYNEMEYAEAPAIIAKKSNVHFVVYGRSNGINFQHNRTVMLEVDAITSALYDKVNINQAFRAV